MLSKDITGQIKCVLCGSTKDAGYIYSAKNTRDTKDDIYNYFQCPDCGLAFLKPEPEPTSKLKRYDEYYENLRRPNIIDRTMRRFSISDCCHLIEKKSGKKGTILDIGCGDGDFLIAMNNRQWDIYGIEPSKLAGQRARRILSNDKVIVTESLTYDFLDESFDVITLWHVLEHIKDPVLLMNEIRRLLKKGGIVVIEVPNADSPMYRTFKEYHYLNLAPEHLFLWSKNSLQYLLNQHDFTIEEISFFQKSRFALSRNIYRLCKPKYGSTMAALSFLLSAPFSIMDKYLGVLGGRQDLIRVICRK